MPDDLSNTFTKKAAPTLTVDWTVYASFLEDTDMTDDQKRELIETVWTLVVSFIDMGFDVRSPEDACGQDAQSDPDSDDPVVNSIKDHWNKATKKSGAGPARPKPPRRSM